MVREWIEHATRGIRSPGGELSALQVFVLRTYEAVTYGSKRIIRDRAPQLAAALAYRTIFSAVPVLVLTLVVVRAFATEDRVQGTIEELMSYLALDEITFTVSGEESDAGVPGVPGVGMEEGGASAPPVEEEAASPASAGAGGAGGEAGGTGGEELGPTETPPAERRGAQEVALTTLVEQFITNAGTRIGTINFGAITIVAVGILVYGALSLLIQIEAAFNAITHATRGRRWTVRLTTYWTVLTLGSLMVFSTFAIRGAWESALDSIPSWAAWLTAPLQVATRLGISWLLLLFLYTRMPTAPVRVRDAAIGAGAAALLWELSKSALTWFIGNATQGQVSVYGSLALVPVTLFWLYVTWLIVLFGLGVAVIAESVRAGRARRASDEAERADRVVDAASAAVLLREVARAFERGERAGAADAAEAADLAPETAQELLDRLSDAGLVYRVDAEESDGEGPVSSYALARPARDMRLDAVLEAVHARPRPRGEKPAEDVLSMLRRRQREALAGLTVGSLLDGDRRAAEGTADGPGEVAAEAAR